jgi:hypothetical protein
MDAARRFFVAIFKRGELARFSQDGKRTAGPRKSATSDLSALFFSLNFFGVAFH